MIKDYIRHRKREKVQGIREMFKMWNRGSHANIKVNLRKRRRKEKSFQTGYEQQKRGISTACPQNIPNVEKKCFFLIYIVFMLICGNVPEGTGK